MESCGCSRMGSELFPEKKLHREQKTAPEKLTEK